MKQTRTERGLQKFLMADSALAEKMANMTLQKSPPASGAVLYVCEATGNDTTGSGTKEMPFKTILRALEQDEGATIVVRKQTQEEDKPASEFAEASAASVKKAKKFLELSRKKQQKEEERKLKDAEANAAKAAEEAAKLERSKLIVIEQDPALPAAEKVCQLSITFASNDLRSRYEIAPPSSISEYAHRDGSIAFERRAKI